MSGKIWVSQEQLQEHIESFGKSGKGRTDWGAFSEKNAGLTAELAASLIPSGKNNSEGGLWSRAFFSGMTDAFKKQNRLGRDNAKHNKRHLKRTKNGIWFIG